MNKMHIFLQSTNYVYWIWNENRSIFRGHREHELHKFLKIYHEKKYSDYVLKLWFFLY